MTRDAKNVRAACVCVHGIYLHNKKYTTMMAFSKKTLALAVVGIVTIALYF